MRPLLLVAFLLIALPLTASAVPVPDRKRYKDPAEDRVELTNTTWVGQDGADPMRFVFEPNGILFYSYKNGDYRNATWKVEGNALYIEMNQKFREFRGVVRDNQIIGDSWNVQGMKWTTTMNRVGISK
jgi:hypothetical protein